MQSKPLALTILDVLSIIVLGISTYLALFFAPTELVMGQVQRVFYFHIGTAWTALMGFILAAVFSVTYLVTKNLKWDRYQVAAIEVSLVFFFLTIVLGSIWARPAWNTWWTWDPRLTTAAVTELIYIAYFMLRQGIDDPERRARFGAVYALIGGLSAPITFF
ncbi:MAG: cytochrome c biogenesis protein CcsA, partial [Anaerolineales bacterium]|nr:cytochrome c biogenesis protein CcsA [Anaerolineales bacterium]